MDRNKKQTPPAPPRFNDRVRLCGTHRLGYFLEWRGAFALVKFPPPLGIRELTAQEIERPPR